MRMRAGIETLVGIKVRREPRLVSPRPVGNGVRVNLGADRSNLDLDGKMYWTTVASSAVTAVAAASLPAAGSTNSPSWTRAMPVS